MNMCCSGQQLTDTNSCQIKGGSGTANGFMVFMNEHLGQNS